MLPQGPDNVLQFHVIPDLPLVKAGDDLAAL